MQTGKSALERAFELARSGQCRTLGEVRRALATECYKPDQIEGPSLLKQLKAIFAARAAQRGSSRSK
jgi:hypothetical protein